MKQKKMNFFKDIHTAFDQVYAERDRLSKHSNKRKPWWVVLLLSLVLLFLYFFFALPSLSPMSYELYSTIIIGLAIFWGLMIFFGQKPKSFLGLKISLIIAALCIIFPFVMTIAGHPIFMSSQYRDLIQVKEGVFEDEIEQININQIPVVDREAAYVIGEKEMGAVGDLVSQFDIASYYSQVNIAGRPIRVSPLEYNDFFKYLWNFKQGIQYYVSVDMTTQSGELNKLEEPIFYSSSDYLMRDLARHLRFQHPFAMFGETNFEIDDNGKAYYVTPKLTKRIALFSAPDSVGVYITDATSGESTFYANGEIPEWVDRAHPSEFIIEQLNWHGKFHRGFFNSMFGQRNVTTTTEGYNYISIGTDIYLITGVTSVRSDTSNLGFYYVNLRTKEASLYQQPSATEYAAMESARGKVQEKGYTPTFPVILNIQDRPVYFMSLKDQSLTAKMFALVDAEQFTNVVVGDTVAETVSKYYEINPGDTKFDESNSSFETFTVKRVESLVEDSNSIVYFLVDENDKIYRADPSVLGPRVSFLEVGEKVEVMSSESSDYHIVHQIKFPD